ncbi:Pentapeptide repeat-containing protein [Desulfonatronum zhilinae]|nr:Pentapeptide repeat-containing protein [Desulfonatronum zhilinae]
MKTWTIKILMLSAMVAVVCLLGIGQAWAWNQADLDKLLETKECNGCDLSGALLYGEDLSGAGLVGAKLDAAQMQGANLSGANLTGANLHQADLTGANLSGAILTNTNLIWTTWTDGRRCAEGSIGECK